MGGGVPKCGEIFLPFLCLKISVVCLVWSGLLSSLSFVQIGLSHYQAVENTSMHGRTLGCLLACPDRGGGSRIFLL